MEALRKRNLPIRSTKQATKRAEQEGVMCAAVQGARESRLRY